MHKFVQILSVSLFLISFHAKAQSIPANSDELLLEDEVNQTTTPAPAQKAGNEELTLDSPGDEMTLDSEDPTQTTPALSVEVSEPATALEPQSPPPRVIESGGPDNTSRFSREDLEDQPEELRETDYAMNGWGFGVVGLNQSFDIKAAILINNATNVDVSNHSADFQSVGGVVRYAILPYYKVGTDISFVGGTTINNESVNYSSINFAKLLLNLGYAVEVTGSGSLYFLLGGGYEYIAGADINKILKPGGGTFQAGVGFGVAKKINLEIFYAYSSHPLSDEYIAAADAAARASNPSIVTVEKSGSSSVTAGSVIGNLIYNF